MKRFTAVAASLLLGLTISAQLPAQTSQTQEDAFMEVFHSISSHELMEYVEEMSSEKYRGRLSGTPEYLQVAEWVAGHLKKWGIKPGGDNGTYLQMFDMPYSEVKSAGALSIEMESGGQNLNIEYSFPDDYYPGTWHHCSLARVRRLRGTRCQREDRRDRLGCSLRRRRVDLRDVGAL